MKNKLINLLTKSLITLALIYLFMSVNNGDIEYIYANF